MGLTEASEVFTLPQWEMVFSFALEVIRYKNSRCSFFVSSLLLLLCSLHLKGVSYYPIVFQVCSRLNCVSGVKVLIEGVIQVPSGYSVCLYLATYIANLLQTHPFMRTLPLISFTCSTPSYSADILVILSSFGVLPVTFIALPKLPHMDLEPRGMLPPAGQKFGPSFFDLLLADCCSTAFGPWDPLSHLRLILDSLNFVKFECRAQGMFL